MAKNYPEALFQTPGSFVGSSVVPLSQESFSSSTSWVRSEAGGTLAPGLTSAPGTFTPTTAAVPLVGSSQNELLVPFGLMLFGYLLQRLRLLLRRHVDLARRICFTIMLPAFCCRNMWSVRLDTRLGAVAASSLCVHGLQFAVILAVASIFITDPQTRGWFVLVTQGEMLALVYPLFDRTLGKEALASALLWDLGGNVRKNQRRWAGLLCPTPSGRGVVMLNTE